MTTTDPIGLPGQILTADSSEPSGLRWVFPPGDDVTEEPSA